MLLRHCCWCGRGLTLYMSLNCLILQLVLTKVVTCSLQGRERVYLPQNKKNIQNHSKYITVAGYQIGKPIKLVAFSTNYSKHFRIQRDKTEHKCKRVCTVHRGQEAHIVAAISVAYLVVMSGQ